MSTRTATTDLVRVGQRHLWFLLLSSALGCSHEGYRCQEGLNERILPPHSQTGVRERDGDIREDHSSAPVGPVSNRPDDDEVGWKPAPQAAKETGQEAAGESRAGLGQSKPPNESTPQQQEPKPPLVVAGGGYHPPHKQR